MARTKEEKNILKLFAEGLLDGQVGKDLITDGGSTVWTSIHKGIIARYKEGPGARIFDGKENWHKAGKRHVLQEWKTDEEVLSFFQKFGWLIDNADVKAYSAKFKPKK